MISIIIPLYNKRETIARTINSVIMQSYQDWELIVIDDGSTDGSDEIVKSFLKDKRIQYILKKNGGVSSARNFGVSIAKGEWIIYIDADDYFLSNALDSLVQMTEEYPVGIVSGNYYAEQNTKRVPVLHRVKRGIVTNNFRSLFLGPFDIRAGATLYRTTILKQYQFDENLSRYEDAKVEFDILRSNKVAITPDYLLVYSKDFSGLSIASGKLEKDFISCMVFENKSFWEKMLLGRLLAEGIQVYSDRAIELRTMYKANFKWMYMAMFVGVFNALLDRLYEY